MSEFWKKILSTLLPVVIKIMELLLNIDINDDDKIG